MRKLTKLLLILVLIFSLHLTLYTLHSFAAIPHLINYQGRLTDSSGIPLNGSYTLTFRIYDAETAGTLLWEETHSGIVIQKGIFSLQLGSVTNLNLPFDKPYWLEIKVGNEVMSPRQRISTSAYAIRAETAENALQAQNADTVSNVGVNTTPAPNKILPLDSSAKIPQSALGLKVYDSGWFPVSRNTTYTREHNLGTTKSLIQVYVSSSPDGSANCGVASYGDYYEPNGNRRNVYLCKLTNNQIKIRIAPNAIFSFIDENGNRIDFPDTVSTAYCRIVVLALE